MQCFLRHRVVAVTPVTRDWLTVCQVCGRDVHGNGIPITMGIPYKGIPYEWEHMPKVGMGTLGRVCMTMEWLGELNLRRHGNVNELIGMRGNANVASLSHTSLVCSISRAFVNGFAS